MKRGEPPGETGSERHTQLGFCVLSDLTGSGKSAFTCSLHNQLRWKQGWDLVVIRYDDIIPDTFFEGKNSQLLPSHWKSFRHELLNYLKHFLMAIINGCK